MALHWLWSEKCGEATFHVERDDEVYDYTVNLYEGNAFLIFIYEYESDGQQMFTVQDFFSDKKDMKVRLGIEKHDAEKYGYSIFSQKFRKLTKLRLNKAKSRNYKDIIKAFIQAFDNIEIDVYSEEVK